VSKNRKDRPEIHLEKYIPPSRFRTVESFGMLRAPSELKTELELSDGFMNALSFHVPWDGKLYAYARPTPEFYEFCGEYGLSADKTTTLYFQDWESKFLLAIEKANGEARQVLTFFVPSSDVKFLLENCCRIRGQKTAKTDIK